MRDKVGGGKGKEEAGWQVFIETLLHVQAWARALGQLSTLVMCFLAWRANETTHEVARASGMWTEALF